MTGAPVMVSVGAAPLGPGGAVVAGVVAAVVPASPFLPSLTSGDPLRSVSLIEVRRSRQVSVMCQVGPPSKVRRSQIYLS